MATRTRQLRVEIVGDPRRIQRTFDSIDRSAGRMAKGFSRATSLIGVGLAAMAGGQVVSAIKSMVDEAREAEKVGRQTAAVIKATGGVANVSAKDVDKLSGSLMRQVAVDDDIIAAGANMLLTFKGVRNEVGKGNDIFTQAERAAVDMAAAMHQGEVSQQGLEKANIMLGKALNDPIRGVTALTRVGVTFTQAQKDQIKALVEAGDVMGAQKIILKELGSEFGGAAKAAVDPWQRFGVVMGEIKERVGTAMLPILRRGAEFITKDFIPAVERFWKEHGPAFRDAVSEINHRVGVFFHQLKENLEPQLERIKDAWNANKDAIKDLVSSLRGSQDEFATAEDTAKSFGDTMVKATEFAGALARMLKRVEGHLNDFKESSDKAAQGIHDKFVRPMAVSMGVLVERWVGGFHAMVRVAATAAEAMHLPWAKSLRKAEQDIGHFREAFNRQMDALRDERVNVTARAGITWTAEAAKFRMAAGRMAAGGPVHGPGTGTSDSVPRWLSRGEFVVNARSAGQHRELLEAINTPGMARGGLVMDTHLQPRIQVGDIDRMVTGVAKSLARGLGEKLTKAMGQAFGGGNWGSGSWMRAISELQADRVAYRIISTFRPGARTAAGGRVSFHALNRAVDLTGPNMMGIFQSLSDTRPTELIYSHAPYYIARGRAKPIGALDNITFMNHLSHVHAAYDRGGWLPPGVSVAINRTGRPERVLAPGEGGITVNFHGPVYGDKRALTEVVRQGIREALRREGKPVTV